MCSRKPLLNVKSLKTSFKEGRMSSRLHAQLGAGKIRALKVVCECVLSFLSNLYGGKGAMPVSLSPDPYQSPDLEGWN